MGNTCGACAYDNRGSEVNMQSRDGNDTHPGYQKKPSPSGAAGQASRAVNIPKSVNENMADISIEFLTPPDYDCHNVMVNQLSL